jgi:hypothetical protein
MPEISIDQIKTLALAIAAKEGVYEQAREGALDAAAKEEAIKQALAAAQHEADVAQMAADSGFGDLQDATAALFAAIGIRKPSASAPAEAPPAAPAADPVITVTSDAPAAG